MSYIESGMDFAPLFTNPEFASFYIEKSYFLRDTKNLKSVEFVTIESNNVHFIEAKNSVPRMRDYFFLELYEKFYHSLNLIATNELNSGNFSNVDLPENFNTAIRNRKVIFVLVVPEIAKHKKWVA